MFRFLALLLIASTASATEAKQTVLYEDLPYAATSNPRQTLHLLLPQEVEAPLPLVISLHGGGWNRGRKDSAHGLLAPLVADGDIALAAVGYRLSGEAVWPAQLDDITRAHRWLIENAAEYGIDPNRIAVYGTSAGGHLAMMLATQPGLGIDAVVSVAGPTDLTTIAAEPGRGDHGAADSIGAQLIGGRLADNSDAARSASPMALIEGDEPPHLLIHGDLDGIIPYVQSSRFDAALEAAGVSSTLIRIAGADHAERMPWPHIRELTSLYLDAIFEGREPELADRTIPYASP